MEPDLRRWTHSYKYVPSGAGEDEIANADTSALQAAHRVMTQCRVKPPAFQFHLSPQKMFALLSEGTSFSYFDRLFLDEALRYARVCRELANRIQSDNPELALTLLKSALLPGSSHLAFDSHDAYMAWEKAMSRHWDQLGVEAERLSGEFQNLATRADEYDEDHRRDVLSRFLPGFFQFAAFSGALHAAYLIRKTQDAWNFRIKASMVILEEQAGHADEAWTIKNECLDLLRLDDELWAEVSKSVFLPAVSLPPAPTAVQPFQEALSQLLDSRFEPLLTLINANLQVTHAVHDRLDFVVEKLIDLDQRSELTWRQISQFARKEPDYEGIRRAIETSLANCLGDGWRRLRSASRKDLIDAEYVFQHCSRWETGWRMAVLGYCTTAERELTATYRFVRDQVFSTSAAGPTSSATFGDLIQSLERLGARLPTRKPPLPGLEALLNSIEQLWRLNAIRNRAAHPSANEVTKDEAVWVKDALLGGILTAIVAVRPAQ